ncbi:DUF6356 family protein [Povalibacter sp.]|uniref:DUF6356 family protein n=1 Tax=Povalibacter sp. TaxID=1962978 RepID=UPI002F3F845B
MTQLRHLFSEHPASVGESYLTHLLAASTFALRMFAGGIACLVHAVLPFLFVHTGSDCVTRLHEEMLARRRGHDDRSRRLPEQRHPASTSP